MKKTTLFLALISFALSTFSQINLENGLVAFFPFTGNTADSSSFSNNGDIYGATLTADRYGNENSAYYFDGIDDYIEVIADANLSASTTELSISVWLKIDNYDESENKEAYILDKSVYDSNSSDWGVKYYDKDQNPSTEELRFCGPLFTPPGTNTSIGYWSTTSPQEDEWYHVVINYDLNDSQEIFINGVSESSVGSTPSTFWENNASLIIGKAANNSSYFNGTIDEIRIYNRILTQEEILFLYDETSSMYNSNISDNFQIYPNPANHLININIADNLKYNSSYKIFDISGKTVSTGYLTDSKINVSQLEKGIYLFQLFNDIKTIGFQKITIE